MYAAFSAITLPAGVLALNLAVAQYEAARVQTIADFQAGAAASEAQKRIVINRTPNIQCPPSTTICTVNFLNLGNLRRQFACMGHDGYPQDPPTISPTSYKVKPPVTTPTEITVTQTITCPSFLFGTATATATITVPIPPP